MSDIDERLKIIEARLEHQDRMIHRICQRLDCDCKRLQRLDEFAEVGVCVSATEVGELIQKFTNQLLTQEILVGALRHDLKRVLPASSSDVTCEYLSAPIQEKK